MLLLLLPGPLPLALHPLPSMLEDPMQIANDIASGINLNNYEIILNRSEAIAYAINNMQDGDVIALCGKGAENYMDEKGIKHPYSDKDEVERWGLNRV